MRKVGLNIDMDYEFLENQSMAEYTTFKVGGAAKRLYKVYSVDGLKEVLDICGDEKPIIIGNGSNLLVSDKGLEPPVIVIGNGFDKITVEGETITAEAGALLSKVAKAAMKNDLEGAEFASGIPGSIGGAIYMNAGAYGGEIKNIVKSVDVIKDGELITLRGDEMDFGYRHSRAMQEDMIIVSVVFSLAKGDKDEIVAKMNDFNSRRRDKQPLEYPSAGSTFKRPEGYFAGKLIMDSGLAGYRVGGAMVSPKHCGFVINYENATATDVYELILHVQEVVKEKFGVMLEPEVKLMGDFS